MARFQLRKPRRETGTADRPTASSQNSQVPYAWWFSPLEIGYTHVPEPPRDSDTQGLGKSPGMRWPWHLFHESRAPSVYNHYRPHWQHALPSRILIAGERGPLNVNYLNYYEQAPRHAWPGGGVIEYAPSLPLASVARRLNERVHG